MTAFNEYDEAVRPAFAWPSLRTWVGTRVNAVLHRAGHDGRFQIGLAVVAAATLAAASLPSKPPASIPPVMTVTSVAPAVTTARSDRLDAYARESRASSFDTPALAALRAAAEEAERRIVTSVATGVHGERRYGIRISVPEGTPVRAAAEGSVEFAGDAADGLGKKVVLRHGAVVTIYAHAGELRVQRGDHVAKGRVIATSGQTGFVSSPRLYLGIISADPNIDPMTYFAKAGTLPTPAMADTACTGCKTARSAGPLGGPREKRPVPPAEIPLPRLSRATNVGT